MGATDSLVKIVHLLLGRGYNSRASYRLLALDGTSVCLKCEERMVTGYDNSIILLGCKQSVSRFLGYVSVEPRKKALVFVRALLCAWNPCCNGARLM